MSENNLRQAMVPVGATIIPQTRGTAPGLICPVTVGGVAKVVFAVPGVPHEMQDMFDRGILPELQRRSGDPSVIASRVLLTWGESESGLNERLDGVIDELEAVGNPTLAFLASGWNGLKVRLTAKAMDAGACHEILDDWEARVRTEIGDIVFGVDDRLDGVGGARPAAPTGLVARAGRIGDRRSGRRPAHRRSPVRATCSAARSCRTRPRSNRRVLGVGEGPVVTESAALEMAHGARRVLGADVGLALTGVAGPAEQDGMPAGHAVRRPRLARWRTPATRCACRVSASRCGSSR